MRALVVSDSHGDRYDLRRLIARGAERGVKIDAFLHCGDGAGDIGAVEAELLGHNPDMLIAAVRGNCDFLGGWPAEQVLTLGGLRILMTHGHHYAVKSSLTLLNDAVRSQDCAIALFGHTHEPCMEMRSALLLNTADGRMLILDINSGKPRVEMVRLD